MALAEMCKRLIMPRQGAHVAERGRRRSCRSLSNCPLLSPPLVQPQLALTVAELLLCGWPHAHHHLDAVTAAASGHGAHPLPCPGCVWHGLKVATNDLHKDCWMLGDQ